MESDGSLKTWGGKTELQTFGMDTKLRASEEHKQLAALGVKRFIDFWHPDVVVTREDIAPKYLIAPYFINRTTPSVSYGIDLDAPVYGVPDSNATGMVEIAQLSETIELLQIYARGNRIGCIGADVFPNRKTLPHR